MKYLYTRGLSAEVTITDDDVRASLREPDATDNDRAMAATVLKMNVGDRAAFTSDRDGATIRFRRIE